MKSQNLLEVAKRYAQFPVILETYRECLQDVLDLPGLTDLLTKLHRRELSLVEVDTPTASPFASSLPRGRPVAGSRSPPRAARP